jgi:hypothetical protein
MIMCLLRRKVTLTKDNLAKNNWKGKKIILDNDETIQHLLLNAHLRKLYGV